MPDRPCGVWQGRHTAHIKAAFIGAVKIASPGGRKTVLQGNPLVAAGLLFGVTACNNLDCAAAKRLEFLKERPLGQGI